MLETALPFVNMTGKASAHKKVVMLHQWIYLYLDSLEIQSAFQACTQCVVHSAVSGLHVLRLML